MWQLANNVFHTYLEFFPPPPHSASDPKSQTAAELCGSRIWDRKNFRIFMESVKYQVQVCLQNRINIGFRDNTEPQ